MGISDFQAKQRINKQKAVLREYFTKYSGQVLCLTTDQTVVSTLAATLKDLAVPQGRLLVNIASPTRTLKAIGEAFEEGKLPALVIERYLETVGDTGFLISQCKEMYPELRVLVLTSTLDKDRIMLLHEVGVDNFILRPLSSNDLLEKLVETLRPPAPIRQLLDKARSFIAKNISEEALKISSKVLEVKPDSAAGYVVLGDALRLTGETLKAKYAYERAAKYAGNYLEPLQRLADVASESGDKETQLNYLKRMDEISPLNAQRKIEIGELHVELGHTRAATQIFDSAVSRAYKDAMDHVAAMAQKIAISLQETAPAQAEKYLRQCLEMKGDNLTVDDLATFNQLGISLRKQGRWEDAITEYKKALKIAPNVPGLYYNIGMAYAEGNDHESAIKGMLKALSISEAFPQSSAQVAYNMGVVFSKGFTRDKAKYCLEIALELHPGYEPAQKLLKYLQGDD